MAWQRATGATSAAALRKVKGTSVVRRVRGQGVPCFTSRAPNLSSVCPASASHCPSSPWPCSSPLPRMILAPWPACLPACLHCRSFTSPHLGAIAGSREVEEARWRSDCFLLCWPWGSVSEVWDG